ncbi:MAG: glycosyltransferase family 4 protein, partial [Gemmatimonadota bacterium]
TEPARPARGPGVGSPPRLVSVGSVTPLKGHDVLVEALERLRDRSWVCVCAGSLERAPDFAREVRTRVSAAGLESRILFLGELDADELEAVYGTASLFVLPSRFEGYGMALTEALARGLPVVSTTGGAIPGTVPADVGILVPPGDAPALAEALAGLLESPERLEERAAAARRYAAELPDWSTQVEAFGRAVVELAGAGPPATRCEGGGS